MLSQQWNGAVINLSNGEATIIIAITFDDDIVLIQRLLKENPLEALQHDFNIWDLGLVTISGVLV